MKPAKSTLKISDADLASYLAGELDHSKRARIKEWLNSEDKNRKYFLKLKHLWKLTGQQGEIKSIDIEQARKKVENKIWGNKQIRLLLLYWRKTAAILFLPFLITVLVYYFLIKTGEGENPVSNEIHIAFGTTSFLVLSDDTEVWLNSGTRLKHPLKFQGKREVYLEGEAYFKVAENKRIPFIVKTQDIDIIASGTSFNVRAYPGENTIETSLISGEISVVYNSDIIDSMETLAEPEPGEIVIYCRDEMKAILKEADTEKITGWKEGKLIFRNDPLDVIAVKLCRWFNTDIELIDEELKSYCYTATFVNESLDQILELLCLSTPIEYTYSPRSLNPDYTYSKRKIEIMLKK